MNTRHFFQKTRRLFLLLVLLTHSIVFLGQTDNQQKKDSLWKLVINTEGEQKVNNYYDYAMLHYYEICDTTSMNAAINEYNNVIKEAEKQKNTMIQAHAKADIIGCYYNMNMSSEIFKYAPQTMDFCKNVDEWTMYYYVYEKYVLHFFLTEQFSRGIAEVQKMYDEAKELNNTEGMIIAIYSFANAYNSQNKQKEAMQYMKEGIDLCNQTGYNKQTRIQFYYFYLQNLINISSFDEFLRVYDEFETALYEYEKSRNSIVKSIFQNYRWILKGLYYAEIKNNQFAELCCDSLMSYPSFSSIPQLITMVDNIRLKVYDNRGQFREAIDLINKIIASDTESDAFYIEMLKKKACMLANMGKAMESYETFDDAYVKNDSLLNAQRLKMLDELRTQYEVEKHIAEKQKAHLSFRFAAGIGALLFVILIIWIFYSRTIQKKNVALVNKILAQEKDRDEIDKLRKIAQENTGTATETDEIFVRLEKFMQEKQAYTETDCNRETLAEAIGTNKTYLSESIKNNTDLSVSEYIMKYRLKHANALLLRPVSEYTIDAVAFDSGFGSRSKFHEHYRAHYGITPNEFRKTIQAKKE